MKYLLILATILFASCETVYVKLETNEIIAVYNNPFPSGLHKGDSVIYTQKSTKKLAKYRGYVPEEFQKGIVLDWEIQ